MSELLNCPFCGQTEPLDMAEIKNLGVWIVECMAEHDGCGASSGMYTSREEMIVAWNRRPQITVTKNESGQIVAVTRTDAEGKILEVIAESAPQAQLTDDHIHDATKLILTESEIDLLHDKHMFEAMDGYCMLDYQGFAKAIAARCGGEQLRQQRDDLLNACEKTIADNKHLADGDDCTLIDLVKAVERCK